MKKTRSLIGLVLAVRIGAAPLPPAAPIITTEELRAAAADVQVARIDFAVPEKDAAVQNALAPRFFKSFPTLSHR